MKSSNLLFAIILSALVWGCGASHAPGPCPFQLEPMYGGQPRTGHCKDADEKYLAEIDAMGHGRADSSQAVAKLGFDYLEHGDLQTAMLRFNQAWILDPKNCMAFNGFGLIKQQRDHDPNEAILLFEKGLELCPGNGFIMSDYGRVLEQSERFEMAVSMFEKSIRLEPENQKTYRGLIRAHIRLGNDQATLNAIRRAQAIGMSVDQKLVQELKKRIKLSK